MLFIQHRILIQFLAKIEANCLLIFLNLVPDTLLHTYSTNFVQISLISLSSKYTFHERLPWAGLPATGEWFNDLSKGQFQKRQTPAFKMPNSGI